MKKAISVFLLASIALITAGCDISDENININITSKSAQETAAVSAISEIAETTASEPVETTVSETVTEKVPEETQPKETESTEAYSALEAEIKEAASEKIKGFNKIHAMLSGIGLTDDVVKVEKYISEETGDIDAREKWIKSSGFVVLDPELKNMDDLNKLIYSVFDHFECGNFDNNFIEKDGNLIICPDIMTSHNGHWSYYFFNPDESAWKYNDITDNSFSVTAKGGQGRHEYNYTITVYFVKTADGWRISDFEGIVPAEDNK